MLMFVAKQYFVLYLKFQASKEFCLFQKKIVLFGDFRNGCQT